MMKDLTKIPSLQEVHQTIPVSHQWPWWRKMLAFAGPGYLVAVGYMDPGNWATDLAAGSQFGYTLLSVILISNLMAIILQSLCAKLGVVSGHDLAQACREYYSFPVAMFLWVLCEIAIAACDLAEVIGSAIALNLLFHLPLIWGVCLTAADILLILYLQNKGFRYIEAIVITLMAIITGCFWLEILFSKPEVSEIISGFIPRLEILTDSQKLYIAIGILGATVMPHNLYLHSAVVQTRKYSQTFEAKKEALFYFNIDSAVALTIALAINAAILIMSSAVFHKGGYHDVAEIQDAYQLLSPILNVPVASTLFALALLASGQNSTLTGTLAGQIVMEGFLNLRLRPWMRRLLTRCVAIVPAIICILFYGEYKVTELLILSQVVLSLQLSFAVFPLVSFTSNKKIMGEFANPLWLKIIAWLVAFFIAILNLKLVFDFFTAQLFG